MRAKTAVVAALIPVLAIALIASACGSSDVVAEPAEAAEVPIELPIASPLEASLGFASEAGRRQYQLISMQQAADQEIVQCMRSAGFFYAVGSAQDRFGAGAFVGDESRDFAAAEGLGITTSFEDALAADATQAAPDPAVTNLDYVASLTAEQTANYDSALVGIVETTAADQSFVPAGCWGDSFADIVMLLALIEEFEPQLDAMNARLGTDPRVLAFQTEWSACMGAAGYRFANETAMVDDVYARLLDIELVQVDNTTGVGSRDALDSLILYEQQVAVASFDCRRSFDGDLASLRYDYEREFLDDNRFRIDELQSQRVTVED